MNGVKPETFPFEVALAKAKQGYKIGRLQFRDTCYIVAKFPDEGSQNTKPYLQMWKKKFQNDSDSPFDAFPVDLSCESIFADDWYIRE